MLKINLFDSNNPEANKCFNGYWPECLNEIEYIHPPLLEFDGISLFTDELCFHPIVDQVKSKIKVAWALESPAVKPHLYQYFKNIESKFDYIFICNKHLSSSNKFKLMHYGACWIIPENCRIYNKSKLISIVASNKNWAPGHILRHEIISKKLHPELELWGSGYKYFTNAQEERVLPFKDYKYTIVIENCRYPGYFTDKILDCFATGSIPIYWGDPEISNYFNPNGFYQWDTVDELKNILAKISDYDYNCKSEFILENFNIMPNFASPDKNLIKLFKEII